MGRMEYGKMIAGCAGQGSPRRPGRSVIFGPLINERNGAAFAASAYLGAKHCWVAEGKNPMISKFKVTWVGLVQHPAYRRPDSNCGRFLQQRYDVVMSGIDTTGHGRSRVPAAEGKTVWAVPTIMKAHAKFRRRYALGVPYSTGSLCT